MTVDAVRRAGQGGPTEILELVAVLFGLAVGRATLPSVQTAGADSDTDSGAQRSQPSGWRMVSQAILIYYYYYYYTIRFAGGANTVGSYGAKRCDLDAAIGAARSSRGSGCGGPKKVGVG